MRFPRACPLVVVVLHLALAPARAVAQVEAGRAALAGVALVATLFADQGLRGEVQEYRGNTSDAVSRVGNGFGDPRYVLPAIGAGLLLGQLTGQRSVTHVALRAGGAVAIAGGMATAVKFLVGRSRPQGDGDADLFRPLSGWNSFPSGHTAVAFALATAIADETRDPWSDAALYGAATLTGLARLNDDRHWTSDVLAGALLGHLSARWLARRPAGLGMGPAGVTMSLEF